MAAHFFPQFDGTATAGRNCGVSGTRTTISWSTRGKVRPNVRKTRKRMGDLTGWTDPTEWERAIASFDTPAELADRFEFIPVERDSGGPWSKAWKHLEAGGMALLAVDYGVYRRSMPRRSGSKSFDGYHAIAFRLDGKGRLISYDSLLDGRYPGCPKGPVSVSPSKVRRAAEQVGKKELGRSSVYMVLVDRAVKLGGVVPGPPDDDEAPTLASVYADLHEALDATDSGPVRKLITSAIEALEEVIGPYQGDGDPEDQPDEGGILPR